MRWQQGRRSTNIQDRRGIGARGGIAIGGGGLIVLVIVGLLLGQDLTTILGLTGQQGVAGPTTPEEAARADFVSVILADTEDTWGVLLPQQANRQYTPPVLVLFSGSTDSACGYATSAVGPFYCPRDQQVYIDLSFFDDLARRFGAPGEFAQAYVIAHEIGHHVQTLLGTSQQVDMRSRGVSEAEANALSVRQELQADCYAGVWAHHANQQRQILEPGDVEQGLAAAAAIGDDRLQRQSQGYVVPESFTHGSSAERVTWFRRGLDSGSMAACDTGI
jgi:predicted metalloprotease